MWGLWWRKRWTGLASVDRRRRTSGGEGGTALWVGGRRGPCGGGCGVGGGDEDALGGVDDLGEVGGGWLGVVNSVVHACVSP